MNQPPYNVLSLHRQLSPKHHRGGGDEQIGRLLRRYEPFPGVHLRHRNLRRSGVKIAPRVCGAQGRSIAFSDGASVHVDAVVWAMGYRERTGWVDVPGAKDTQGRLIERRGISPVRDLYFVGRDWQWTRGSALLAGVSRDATLVAERIRQLLPTVGAQRVAGVGAPGGAALAAGPPHV